MSRGAGGRSETFAAGSNDASADTSATFRAREGGGSSSGRSCRQPIIINLASCKYSVLRVVQQQLGWEEDDEDEAAHVFWCDTSAGTERLMTMSPPQRLNHFPGMREIARKKGLARNLGNMSALFPEHFDFHPRTFLLPEQTNAFLAQLSSTKGSSSGKAGSSGKGGGKKASTPSASARPTFILKLDNGSMGRGIRLVQTAAQAAAALPCFEHENVVASEYLPRPLLIDGRKCDLRIYVLVRSCAPLRAFLCRQGLVRLCAERYEPPAAGNLGRACMHLSNYAVNKHHAAYVFNRDAQEAGEGSKWTISAFAEWMERQGHDFNALWSTVKEMVAKTLISIQPMLQYQYECATKSNNDGLTCFELLGLDVLVDEELRPWLIEVNHSPSLSTDTPLDLEVKSRVVREALELVGVQPERVHAELAAQERVKQQRLYAAGPATAAAQAGCEADSEAAAVSSMLRDGGCAAALDTDAAPHAERGSARWLEAQQKFEDAHLGQFDRILPPADSATAALYDQLLAGALQVFYRSTMEGRNQQKLNELREQRQQEEAEAAARQEMQQRRAEALKQWIAGVCQRHRQERARQQELGSNSPQQAACALPNNAAHCMAEATCADRGPSAAGSAASSSRRDSRAAGRAQSSCGGNASVQAAVTAFQCPFSHFADAQDALPMPHSLRAGQGGPRQQRRASGALPGSNAAAAGAAAKPSHGLAARTAGAWTGLAAGAAAADDMSPCSAAASSIVSSLGAGSSGGSFEVCSAASTDSVGRCAEPKQWAADNLCSSSSSSIAAPRVPACAEQRQTKAVALERSATFCLGEITASTPCPSRPSSAALSVWHAVSRRSSSAAAEACQSTRNSARGVQALQQHAWQDLGDAALPDQPAASGSSVDRGTSLQQHASCGGVEAALQAQPSSGNSSSISNSCSVPASVSGSGSGSGRSSSTASAAEVVSAQACPGALGFGSEPTYVPAAMLSALSAVRTHPSLPSAPRRRQSIGRASSGYGELTGSAGQAVLGLPRAVRSEAAAVDGGPAPQQQLDHRPVPVPALIPGVRSRCTGRSVAGPVQALPPACAKASSGGGTVSDAARQYRADIQRQAAKAVGDLISACLNV